MSDFVQREQVTCRFDSADGWVVLTPIEQSIKRKIEAIGTPLKDWDINIYRGVLTGCNEAFIINTDKRNEILSNCQSEEERTRTEALIRPILRGRDIKRYGYDWAGLYVIEARLITNIPVNYPAVCKHLEQYRQKGKLGDNSTTKVFHRPWWAWMQEPVNYWEDFSKPKLLYADITEKLNFCLCKEELFCNNTAYFITSENEKVLENLHSFLNTSVADWYYKTLSVQLGEKAVRMFSVYVLEIPVPLVSDKNIYDVLGLTHDEIKYIEMYQRVSSSLDNSL